MPSPSPAHVAAPYLPSVPTAAAPATFALPGQVEDPGDLVPELRAAWDRAVAAGAAVGVPLTLTSGHRSAAQQQVLWDEGVVQHGSAAEAAKWVTAPWVSAHVRGLALDVGPTLASQGWLEAHQDQFGLCRRFVNETWHFELRRPGWTTCPPLVADATVFLLR